MNSVERNLAAVAEHLTTARRIRGRKNFDLRSELMVGHKVGLITGGEIPSDGPRRRDT